jgi:DNA polymerase-3 subunit beta
MKLHCHRPSLAAAFGIVGSVVPTRTPKEILKNVRLVADRDSATLTGTDAEVGIRYTIRGVEVEQPGETLLPAQRVMAILRELTEEQLSLEILDGKVHITSGHSEFRLSPEDPADFPTVAAFDQEAYYAIAGDVLREAIRRTLFATDVESTRYALGGVLVEPGPKGLTLAATDSRRLAVVEIPCETHGNPGSGPSSGAVIPSKAMGLIEKSIAGLEGDEVWLALRHNDVLVKSGNGTIVSRLVEGRFPKYRQVIPTESPIVIDMVAGPFYTAVRQAQIVTSDESRGVDFTFSDGTLILQSQAADVGASKIELPIAYHGADLTITFDARYLADFLRVLDPETALTLHLTDSDSQAVARVGDDYTYVIMPLTRDNEA